MLVARGECLVGVNYRWLCMQSSKEAKGLPRKFVFLQSSSPDVQREGGGGKTNISLLESSEEWALGLKTSTIRDRTQKFGEKMKGTRHLIRKLRSVLVSWLRFFVQNM